MEMDVFNYKGNAIKKVELPSQIFDLPVNRGLLHEVITAHRASIRAGTASTKTRVEVSGGGAKPWRQKGTGRARAGSIRSPLWRKGGITFGPKPRSYMIPIPKKKKRAALCQALSEKVRTGECALIDTSNIFSDDEKPKTRKIVKMLRNIKVYKKKVLLIVDKKDDIFFRASRNIRNFSIFEAHILHAYAILNADNVLITEEAIEKLKERILTAVASNE